MSPNAIFFDFDGVIVESNAVKDDAFAALYAAEGAAFVDRVVAYHRAHRGLSRYEKFRLFEVDWLGRSLDEDRMRGLDAQFSALAEDAVAACPFVPGAEALLRREARRRPLFIISGTPEPELRRIAERRAVAPLFAAIRGAPMRKPAILAQLLDDHGGPAADALFVGDALEDHAAAAAHGVPFIGRVPLGAPNPFPPDVVVVADMNALGEAIAA